MAAADLSPRKTPSWLLMLAVGVLAAFMLHRVEQQWQAHSWVPTPATILASSYRSVPRGGYEARARFAYTVNGQPYTSTQAAFGSENTSFLWSGLDRWFARYTRPGQVSCYVDPAHPDRAVLDRSYSVYDVVLGVGSGLIFLLLACGALFQRKAA